MRVLISLALLSALPLGAAGQVKPVRRVLVFNEGGFASPANATTDQAIITVDETVWDANGASILLLYGKALERSGNATIADLVYQAAAERGRRERGSALITADSMRADLAARRGDRALALKLSEEAFCTALDGRSRIGQEYYKVSFVATSQSVGDQYRRLHAKAGARPRCDRVKRMSPTL